MKKLRAFGSLLTYLALTTLLVVENTTIESFKVFNPIQTENSLSQTEADEDQSEAYLVIDLSLDAVFSVVHLPVVYTYHLIFNIDFPFIEYIFPVWKDPALPLPYFENTFCRIIAINAP